MYAKDLYQSEIDFIKAIANAILAERQTSALVDVDAQEFENLQSDVEHWRNKAMTYRDNLPNIVDVETYAGSRAEKYGTWGVESHKLIRLAVLDTCDWLRSKLTE